MIGLDTIMEFNKTFNEEIGISADSIIKALILLAEKRPSIAVSIICVYIEIIADQMNCSRLEVADYINKMIRSLNQEEVNNDN